MPAHEPPVQRTWSAEEFNTFVNGHGRPTRDDDRCVLAVGPDGVWQVATDDEIAAWLDKHGASRPTLDFDLCGAWDLDNLGRLVDALRELGAELRVRPGVQPPTVDAHLLHDSVVTTWRTTAGDIDVLVGIPSSPQAGLNRFDSLRGRAEARVVTGCTVYVASLTDIIASKRVANRPADREALSELKALADQQAPGAEPERHSRLAGNPRHPIRSPRRPQARATFRSDKVRDRLLSLWIDITKVMLFCPSRQRAGVRGYGSGGTRDEGTTTEPGSWQC
jgi:hypothetical protein